MLNADYKGRYPMVKLIMVWANITAVTFIVKLNWGADTLLGTQATYLLI